MKALLDMKALLRSPLLIISVWAAPASAQNGALWVEKAGLRLSMDFSGSDDVPVASFRRSAPEMAFSFKNVCMSTDENSSMLVSPAILSNNDLTAKPFTIPRTRSTPTTTLNIWHGKGAVISRSEGFYAADFAQCNVLFYLDQLEPLTVVTEAITNAIGRAPVNEALATKRNGKPNRSYRPEWKITYGGVPRIVTAHAWEGSPVIPGSRVFISMRTARKTK